MEMCGRNKVATRDELHQRIRLALKDLALTATGAAFATFGQSLLKAVGGQKIAIKIAKVNDEDLASSGSAKLFSFPHLAEADPFSSSVLIHLFDKGEITPRTQMLGLGRTTKELETAEQNL